MDTNVFLPNHVKKYECKLCLFITSNKTNYNIHLDTKKHKKQELLTNTNENTNNLLQILPKSQEDLFSCDCDLFGRRF